MSVTPISTFAAFVGSPLLRALTQDDARIETYDAAKVQGALDMAEDVAKAYVRTMYEWPSGVNATLPDSIARAVFALALESVYARAQRETPRDVTERASKALAFLKDVQAGKAVVEGLTAADKGWRPESRVSVHAPERVFTDEFLSRM